MATCAAQRQPDDEADPLTGRLAVIAATNQVAFVATGAVRGLSAWSRFSQQLDSGPAKSLDCSRQVRDGEADQRSGVEVLLAGRPRRGPFVSGAAVPVMTGV